MCSGSHPAVSKTMAEESLRKLTTTLTEYCKVIADPFNIGHFHPCYSVTGMTVVLGDQRKRQLHILEHLKSIQKDTTQEQNHIFHSQRSDLTSVEDKTPPLHNVSSWPDFPNKYFANKIELPEWLVDIPSDLKENWFAKPCPRGQRVLLVAHQGMTRGFNFVGKQVASFNSVLPGGGRTMLWGFTVLSCVWSLDDKTYYILDVISWNDSVLFSCETDFRFYWLQRKINENPEIECETKDNEYALVPVPVATCDKSSLTELMTCYPLFSGESPPDLDGILFYHKKSHLGIGQTPLVTWLHPFMMKDVFGIDVHPEYLREKQWHFDKALRNKEFVQVVRAQIASLRTVLFIKRRSDLYKIQKDALKKGCSGNDLEVQQKSGRKLPAPNLAQQQRIVRKPASRTLEHFELCLLPDQTQDDITEAWQVPCYSNACTECTFVNNDKLQWIRQPEQLVKNVRHQTNKEEMECAARSDKSDGMVGNNPELVTVKSNEAVNKKGSTI